MNDWKPHLFVPWRMKVRYYDSNERPQRQTRCMRCSWGMAHPHHNGGTGTWNSFAARLRREPNASYGRSSTTQQSGH